MFIILDQSYDGIIHFIVEQYKRTEVNGPNKFKW